MSGHPEGKQANSTPTTYGKDSDLSAHVCEPLPLNTVGGAAPNAASWPSEAVAEGVIATVRGGSGAGSA